MTPLDLARGPPGRPHVTRVRAPPAPSRQVLEIALDLARGLAAAHRCGVLHGDVKPANAILSDDGRAKLVDFGLAGVVDGSADDEPIAPPRERFDVQAQRHLAEVDTMEAPLERSATGSNQHPSAAGSGSGSPSRAVLVGTPLYMAPE